MDVVHALHAASLNLAFGTGLVCSTCILQAQQPRTSISACACLFLHRLGPVPCKWSWLAYSCANPLSMSEGSAGGCNAALHLLLRRTLLLVLFSLTVRSCLRRPWHGLSFAAFCCAEQSPAAQPCVSVAWNRSVPLFSASSHKAQTP